MIKMLKIKDDVELENFLNFIYEEYILEDNQNLDESAVELKKHYDYVLKDLEEHEYIEIKQEESKWKNIIKYKHCLKEMKKQRN